MAEGFDINTFTSSGLTDGGARPSLFQCVLAAPAGLSGVDQTTFDKFAFTCQSASLPAFNEGIIEVPYFGRKIKVMGNRTFDEWEVEVQNDTDFKVRAFFEMWNNSLNSLESNIMNPAYDTGDNSYKVTMNVNQYGRDGSIIRGYDLIGAWPAIISAINLNWETTNAIETFTVRFAYDYFLPSVELNNAYLPQTTVAPASTS